MLWRVEIGTIARPKGNSFRAPFIGQLVREEELTMTLAKGVANLLVWLQQGQTGPIVMDRLVYIKTERVPRGSEQSELSFK